MKRLFVGGLFPGVTEDDIIERFKRFGEITGVERTRKQRILVLILSDIVHGYSLAK